MLNFRKTVARSALPVLLGYSLLGLADTVDASPISAVKIGEITPPPPTELSSRYSFTELRRSDETLAGLRFSLPAITENGDVVWRENRQSNAGAGIDAIVKSDGTGLDTLVTDGGPQNFDIGASPGRAEGFGVSGDGGLAFVDKNTDTVILRRPDGTFTSILTGTKSGVDCCYGVSNPVDGTSGRVGVEEVTFGPRFTVVADGLTRQEIGDTEASGIEKIEVRVTDSGFFNVLTAGPAEKDRVATAAPFSGTRIEDFAINLRGDVMIDNGNELLYQNINDVERLIATTAGPYAGFDDLNFNDDRIPVFQATRDFETDGVFTGNDSIADALLSEGSTLFGEQVTKVDVIRDDAINDAGQIALRVETVNGAGDPVSRIVRADPRPLADRMVLENAHALLSTFAGQSAQLVVPVSLPGAAFSLGFSYDVLAGDPLLAVSFGGESLASLGQGDTGIWEVAGVEPTPFGPEGTFVDLVFELTGTGVVALDDLVLKNGGQTLSLGGFENGLPDFFRFDGDGGVTIAARSFVVQPIPIPAAGMSMLLTFAMLGLLRWGASAAQLARHCASKRLTIL